MVLLAEVLLGEGLLVAVVLEPRAPVVSEVPDDEGTEVTDVEAVWEALAGSGVVLGEAVEDVEVEIVSGDVCDTVEEDDIGAKTVERVDLSEAEESSAEVAGVVTSEELLTEAVSLAVIVMLAAEGDVEVGEGEVVIDESAVELGGSTHTTKVVVTGRIAGQAAGKARAAATRHAPVKQVKKRMLTVSAEATQASR